jgi:hypothetical protein
MKYSLAAFLFLVVTSNGFGAELRPDERVVERGAHHRVVERTYWVEKKGKYIQMKARYTDLQNGMHYFENGEWKESEELIDVTADGAAATRGYYKVFFKSSLIEEGAIQIEGPGARHQHVNVLGLTIQNSVTGEERILGTVKDCAGEILGRNQVIYSDAFDGIVADVRYTYKVGSFEQDVILHEEPILPAGWAPEATHLKVLTQFGNLQEPKKTEGRRKQNPVGGGVNLVDELLDFGDMVMTEGKAFSLQGEQDQDNGDAIPVFKKWSSINDKNILSETLEYHELKKLIQLQRLPKQRRPRADAKFENPRDLFPKRTASVEPRQMRQVASATASAEKGVVIDYVQISASGAINFLSDQTYRVINTFTVNSGSIIQGGAIVKFLSSPASALQFLGTVTFPTEFERKAVFTHVNDNRVGENIGSGTPGTADGVVQNGVTARYVCPIELVGASSASIYRLDIRFAQTGLKISHSGSFDVKNLLFEGCLTGIQLTGNPVVTVDRVVMIQGLASNPFVNFTSGTTFNFTTPIDTSGNAPQIIDLPVGGRTIPMNQTFTLSVNASGAFNSYQWYKDGVSLSDGGSISGTKTPSLVFLAGQIAWKDTGTYYVRVWNDFGIVKTPEVDVIFQLTAPAITTQPQNQALPAGSFPRFFVTAEGTTGGRVGTYTYQWKKNGVDISGATSYELILPNIQAADAGSYQVAVRGTTLAGTTLSAPATLAITTPADTTYSSTFNAGQKINLNTTGGTLAPNPQARPLPYLNVALSGRGTMGRVDVNTGQVVGEYRTAPPEAGPGGEDIAPDPSRTTVDKYGNVWVGNRRDKGGATETDTFFDVPRKSKGSVARFGIVIGGTRGRKNPMVNYPTTSFTPDPKSLQTQLATT